MSPIPQATPPMPTPNPNRVPQPVQQPSGSFGATGEQTGSQMEGRIYDPRQGPKPPPDLWGALTRAWEFQPPQQIQGNPQRGPYDDLIAQAALTVAPIGRVAAGLRALPAAARIAGSRLPNVARSAATGGRNVRQYGNTGPWGDKAPLQETLTQQLRQIHRRAKAGKPDLLEGEALAARRRLYADPSRKARYDLQRKGALDENMTEILGLKRPMRYGY